MKRLLPLFIAVVSYSCNSNEPSGAATTDPAKEKIAIAAMLDSVNTAAANADYDSYFRFYTPDAVFIGTDATEHWNKEQFMVWAKPYFEKNPPGILNPWSGIFISAHMKTLPGLMKRSTHK